MNDDKFKTICNGGYPFLSIGALPTSYLESLSYAEQLLWLCNKLQTEIMPQLNINTEWIKNADLNFTNLQEQMTALQKDFEQLLTDVANQINTLFNQQNIKIDNELANQWTQTLTLLNNYQNIFNTKLNDQYNELIEKINEVSIGKITVYNPTTGMNENIDKVLNDIYDSLRYDAITCTEFDGLELTATEYDNKQITAFNFDNNGKSILMP